jgi:hypothetical protein
VSNTDPTKTRGWTQDLLKGTQFLLLIRHSPCDLYMKHFLVQNRIKQQYLYMLITLRYSPLNNLQTFERIFLGLKLSRFKSGFSHRFTKTVKFSKWWLQLYQPNRTLGSVTSLLAATLYQWNPDRKHKLISYHLRYIYILHMQVLLECCYI